MTRPECRFCGTELIETFIDLGLSPPSNAYLTADQLDGDEPFFPLHARVCSQCLLVQLTVFETPEKIFGDYAYFSSCSQSWLDHSRRYVEAVTQRYALGPKSRVIELACNDGYLLQYFMEKGIAVLGVEPARNVAEAAIQKGIQTEVVFFGMDAGRSLRERGWAPDLLLGNNVLAHVPDLNDFVAGMKILLKDDGVITMEFPHLLRLIERNQFDTIYHEHFSYFSFAVAERVFAHHGLNVFDVDELPTHGGSLRIYACHNDARREESENVEQIKRLEKDFGLEELRTYHDFERSAKKVKDDLLEFLAGAKRSGKNVVGYGAPAKGNTLLNYCGVNTDLLPFTVDISPHKQGKYLPGTHIPIRSPEAIRQCKPNYVLILPWNIKAEIMEKMADIRSWGGKFVIPIPQLEILE